MSGMRVPSLTIVVMGTGPFAVPMFRSLLDAKYRLPLLVTRPARARAGRGKPHPQPMRDLAVAHGIDCFDPEDVNTDEARARLVSCQPDLLVVCDYGQILASATLAVVPLGGINLHGSLLPKYRGAAPVQWAVLSGDDETGVTVIHMTPRLDGGPCLAVARTTIGAEEDAEQLERRLAELGVPLVHDAIRQLTAWDRHSPIGSPQDASRASRAPRLHKSDGEVRWTESARRIANQVRGLKPWPGTYAFMPTRHGEPPLRVILERVSVVAEAPLNEFLSSASRAGAAMERVGSGSMPPGTIVASAPLLWVATGDGVLSIEAVQPAGKRVMPIAEFLRGHKVDVGQRLA